MKDIIICTLYLLIVISIIMTVMFYWEAKSRIKFAIFIKEIEKDIVNIENRHDHKLLSTLVTYAKSSYSKMYNVKDMIGILRQLLLTKEAIAILDKISKYHK